MIIQGDFHVPTYTASNAEPMTVVTATTQFVQPPSGVRAEDSAKKAELPPVELAAPIKSELNVDWELVDYLNYGMVIKPKKFLGDLWSGVNQELTANNYRWSREDKAWLFQPGDEAKATGQPKKAATEKGGKITRVSEIAGQRSVNIEGTLQFDPSQRDINTKRGPTTVTDFKVSDGSGVAKVTFWGESGNTVMGLAKGDRVRITALMVGEPYEGSPQLTAGTFTKVAQL
jgi:hypothetical protein